ncbi:ATP-dependent nuclease [Pedobacter frigiditerrae]|uniref:ATP-dependent nuclease n=1 Tax=Pedobacter frigiditerrae TaxID=2530452 RepID=UPI002930791F|nr:AAA family ATPase [Pedobacter frigiditerrae]
MKYQQFRIQNFKGIEDITFNLDKSPDANIYTLVGLNESGKTTILEAMNLFSSGEKDLNALDLPGSSVTDYEELIPISKRDNFNGLIKIEVTLKLEKEDLAIINNHLKKNTELKQVQPRQTVTFIKNFEYKNSKYEKSFMRWSGFSACTKRNPAKYIPLGDKYKNEINLDLAKICLDLLPNILYFPNFLFDFPNQILLEASEKPSPKEAFYFDLIQDILNSLENGTTIQTHLIDRIKSENKVDKKSLQRLNQLMEKKITEVVFEAWNIIFKRKILDTRVKIDYDTNENNLTYLEFTIEANDGIYQINNRSLGFRWFFVFLLFTQFRPFRKDSPSGIIFLFDEPASNLHSSAQQQLLKSFENLIGNGKIIYTTHSHHLINPIWLESTYVVKNEGLRLERPEEYDIRKTNIIIQPYREFAAAHPHNTAYFQPILDVLDYTPSNLENVPNCVFLEGKNDYYTLKYFKDVILKLDLDLNMAPSTSSSNMDTLISLYLGWGKEFLVLLDSDKEGHNQLKRYVDSFGISVEGRIFTLENIDANWKKIALEKIFRQEELLAFQTLIYPDTTEFNKTHFNRAIQECLIKKTEFDFSQETRNNFNTLLNFLALSLNNNTNLK